MKLGVVGQGVVGSALIHGFTKLGHEVLIHDRKLKTTIATVLETDLIFICVPTPMNEDGSCDTSIVESVVREIAFSASGSTKFVVIKSTVTPGTTDKLNTKYGQKWPIVVVHSAEFLRERCATTDFVENQKLLVVGTDNITAYSRMVEAHGRYAQNVVQMTATESELLKLYHNAINALRVSFANEFYDIAEQLPGVNYNKIKNALLYSTALPDVYLDVNKDMRGWSSICWNKDIPAICKLGKDLGLDLPILYNVETSNNRHKRTPFSGTRESY